MCGYILRVVLKTRYIDGYNTMIRQLFVDMIVDSSNMNLRDFDRCLVCKNYMVNKFLDN